MAKFGIGQGATRVEDQRFITGKGTYTDDINAANQVFGTVVRSPVANAVLKSVNVDAAKAAPGVLAVITGKDFASKAGNVIPCMVPIKNRDGSDRADILRPILAIDKLCHVGDHIAFVVAETAAQAQDAAELVEVDFEELPAVHDTATATGSSALVHENVAKNLAYDWQFGDETAVETAFSGAAKTVKIELVNNRVIANAMEPRACVADFDKASGRLTLHVCGQGVWMFKTFLAEHILNMPAENVRVVTPDVGGGFGMKAFFYPEYALSCFASRELGRPVKWTGDRSESMLVDAMGRDHVTTAELAFDSGHHIVGMRVHTIANMGAYLSTFAPFIPTGAALKVLPGVYDVKHLLYHVEGVFTNTTPVDAYRGAGRPESIYCMERLIEAAARDLGVDRAELRRKNFIQSAQMPFTTTAGETYDSGEFDRVMAVALENSEWNSFESRRKEAAQKGRFRGIGMCYYIESTMGNPNEATAVRFEEDGTVSVAVGTQNNGQGHETAYAQIISEFLGVPFESVRLIEGDSDLIASGGGTGGSRSVTAQGTAIRAASEKVIERGKHYAAQEFEAAVADIEFADGVFQVRGTDRSVDIMTLAKKAKSAATQPEGYEGGLDADASITLEAWTFPNGCHIAEVEIDADTGTTDVVRYTVVDDFGKVINPTLVAGQIHGGVAQGIGQALMERTVFDDNGQLLSGSFMDYCMPRADTMPNFMTSTEEILCRNNPLGMKGCGEAGSVGACAAVINALIDALSPIGVRNVDMPATPESLWTLMNQAKAA